MTDRDFIRSISNRTGLYAPGYRMGHGIVESVILMHAKLDKRHIPKTGGLLSEVRKVGDSRCFGSKYEPHRVAPDGVGWISGRVGLSFDSLPASANHPRVGSVVDSEAMLVLLY